MEKVTKSPGKTSLKVSKDEEIEKIRKSNLEKGFEKC